MNKSVIYKFFIVAATSVLTSCVDSLFEDSSQYGNDLDGVGFSLYVKEQPDMKINIGTSTRSGSTEQSGAAEKVPAPSNVRALEGDNPYALKMQYMTLPYVGIHNGAVRASATQTQTSGQSTGDTTRAAWDDHVSSAETFHDSLTVWGYTRDAATKIFDKTLVQRITNWRTSRHWPFGETGPMRFYAVAPSLESINMSVTDADFSTPPILTYTLPEKAQDMCDLLYGESGDIDIPSFGTEDSHEGKDDKNVNLQFQHILTAIRFAQGTIPSDVTVKKISIKNVNTKATFIPSATDNMTDTKGTWSDFSTRQDFSMYADYSGSGLSNTYINDSVFYMLPQTVPNGVELEVVIEVAQKYNYEDAGIPLYEGSEVREHTLHCSLAGDSWKKGYTVTYLLTIGEVADGYYFVAVDPAENEHSDVLETHSFTLHSYRMYVDKENDTDINTRGVNWKVVGYYSDEECKTAFDGDNPANAPKWLPYGVSGNNSGTTTGVYVGGNSGSASYSLSAQEATKSGNHATNLLSNSNASPANSLDLSKYSPNGDDHSANPETANCYIINRTGSYKFPLVYGNKSNEDAEADYFVDHTGIVISHQYIKAQMEAKNTDFYHYTAYVDGHNGDSNYALERYRKAYTWEGADEVSLRAVVVWQDVENMITSVSANGTNNEITFVVGKSTPGNAVIALQAKSLTKFEKRTYNPSGTGTFSDWLTDTSKGTNGYSTGEPWETLWTWHIWMTDEVYPNYSSTTDGATNSQYLNYNASNVPGNYIGSHTVVLKNWGTNGSDGTIKTILPVNLGWVPQEMAFKYYSKREVYVKLLQVEPTTDDARTTVVHIVQHAKQPLVRGQGTFYQWGRPTALPGYNFTDDSKTKRTIYFSNSSPFSESDFVVENITAPYEAITRPTKLFRINESGKTSTWSSAMTGGKSVPYWGETKTVYDPCPPGFKVPHYNIFTGLSLTGETNTEGLNLNMWSDAGDYNYGGYFYVEPHTDREALNRYAQTVYFPSTGQYQATKNANSELWGTNPPNNNFLETMPCTVWSNQLSSDDNKHADALNLFPNITRTLNSSKPAVELPRAVNLSTACAIRPVEE